VRSALEGLGITVTADTVRSTRVAAATSRRAASTTVTAEPATAPAAKRKVRKVVDAAGSTAVAEPVTVEPTEVAPRTETTGA